MASSPISLPPKLPEFASVVDDSPSFHQSLKYWTYKSSQIGSTVQDIATSLHNYHESGSKHFDSGNAVSEVLNRSSQVFKDDDLLEEPLSKFADALNRIECYRSMLLTQTQMLGVEPMLNMVKEMEKTKTSRDKVTKLSQAMHIAWERFAALPHESNVTDPQLIDKHAHNMITLRQKYQLLLAEYVENVREINTTKKVALLQRVLEHMFAEFSYFNYCCQILKDLEPYMTELFESLQKKQRDYEQLSLLDDSFRRETENKVDIQAQSLRKLFPMGENSALHSNTPSHFLNKVGGFLSSGVKDLKKQYKDMHATSPASKKDDTEWEVIEDAEKVPNEEETSQFYVPLNQEVVREDVTSSVADDAEKEVVKVAEKGEDEEEEDKEDKEDKEENKEETNVDNVDQVSRHETDGIFMNNKVAPIEIPKRFELNDPSLENVSKSGYLRIKQRGFHKSRYPLLYFILDKGFGELLSQGQDQKQPRLFAKLQLTNVKPCNPSETDRNYCFILRTSDSEYILQASNAQEYEDWIKEIQDGIMAAIDGSLVDRNRSVVHGNSLKSSVHSHKPLYGNVVERIKNVDGNKFCADCECAQPGWASTNIGVVICIECSGIHRGLGVQVSKIKSLSLDKWDNSLVEFMECNGNTKINRILEANLTVSKITKLSSKAERLDYIVAKYVTKAYCAPEEIPQVTVDKINDDIDNDNEEVVLSDSTDDDLKDMDASVMCLVKDCQDISHCHPPNLS